MTTRPIDEKIVVMKLDNSDFNKKAAETTTIFGSLVKGLNKIPGVNLGKTSQDLNNIATSANNVQLGKIETALASVTSRFSTLGIVGVTALTNITNRAVDAGLAMAKSLTLDQVTSGFQEYETKIGSIGTVLANTEWAGTTLDDVKRVLEELNVYADNTVYSFSQMTENIGRFTAAGVSIDDSAIAIKGLSNLAAASGSNVQQLNTAMYQMSQSMAAGTFNLMDWNSLVNAGMAGKKTQDALLATAKAMGVNVDMSEGFRNSIQQGWLSSEVFLETMKKFGKDESMTEAATAVRTFTGMMDSLKESIGSGWATTWELIFGDFEEATKFWTGLSSSVTGFFAESTKSRNDLIEGLAETGGIDRIFEGLQNAIKPISQLFSAMGEGFSRVFPPATASQLMRMTDAFRDFTAGLEFSEGTMSKLTTIFQGAFSVFSSIFTIVKAVGSAFINIIPSGAGGGVLGLLEKIALMAIAMNESIKEGNILTKTISGLGKILGSVADIVMDVIGGLGEFTSTIFNNLGGAIDWLKVKLAPVADIFKEAFGGFSSEDALGAGTLAGIIFIVKKLSSPLEALNDMFDNIGSAGESFSEALGGIGESVQAFTGGIKVLSLMMIAVALGILTASIKSLEGVKTEDITKSITTLAASLGVMIAGLAVIGKFNITGSIGASVTLIALATAVTIMASALKKISDLDVNELKTGMTGLVGVTGALALAVVAISKLGGKMSVGSLQLLALSTSIVILANAVKTMSTIDPGDLFTAVGAMTLIFAQLAIFLKVVNKSKFGPGAALGVIGLAGAISLMVGAISDINKMDIPELVKGLTSVGIILAQIAVFSKLASGPNIVAAGAGMLLIAGALNLLIPPIQDLANMSMEELAKGLGAMAIALVAVAGAGILASGTIGGAIAITAMAVAMNLLVIPIKSLAELTWQQLATSLLGLGAALAIVGGGAMLLTPAIPAMLGFAGAIALMGVAVLAAGVGIGLFGTGLATLATLTAGSIASIVATLGLLIKSLTSLIPATIQFVVDIGVALIDGIRRLVPPLVDVILYLVVSLLNSISKYLPKFLELGVKIIVQLLDGISKYVPVLINACIDLMIDLIDGMTNAIRDNGPRLISSIIGLLGEIILLVVEAGIQTIDALLGWMPGVKKVTADIGKTAEEYIRNNFGASDVANEKGNEFVTGLNDTKKSVKEAGHGIGLSAKDGVDEIDLTSAGKQAGKDFAKGLRDSVPDVKVASDKIARAADESITKNLRIQSPSKVTEEHGKDTGEGFVKGIKSKKKDVAETAEDVAKTASDEFNKKMDDTAYKFKMEEIDSTEYVAEIEKIKDSYAGYPELVKKANLEIKKIEEDAAKHREDLRKQEFNNSKTWISERKHYNELSLVEELAAWERVMERYAKGTDERKEAEKEVYRLKNDINQQLISLNDEYTAKIQEANNTLIESERQLNDEYTSALNSRTQALTNFAGLFDEVVKKNEVSGTQLLNNLKSQVDVFVEWSQNLNVLTSRGVDDGLITELRDMGPKAASEIAALNTLTDEQLSEYVNTWRVKNALARQQATTELEGMRIETEHIIQELRRDTQMQLEMYTNEWATKVEELKKGVTGKFVTLTTDMKTIGNNAVNGLMVGMQNMVPSLMATATSIASQITATINSALKIKSPSRVTTASGEFVGDGLIVGMKNRLKGVGDGAKGLAETAKDSLNNFIESMNMPSDDNTIHIKAVIDYSELNTSHLNDLSTSITPNLNTTKLDLDTVTAKRYPDTSQSSQNTDNSRSYNPVFNIHAGNTAKDIAKETDKRMRRYAYEFGV